MHFKLIINYFLGYAKIKVEGYFLERFINMCNNQNMFLWNLKRINSTTAQFNINIKDFKKLRKIVKKTKCRIKICEKKGLPFFFFKYRKRKMFVISCFIIATIIIILSNFIWNIEIKGTKTIKEKEIKEILFQNNLKIGTNKMRLNLKQIIDDIRLKRKDVAWVGIEIKGTNAIIKVVEACLKPEIVKEEEYCNIIAIKPGIINKVSAQNGTPVVKEYDLVKKGDVLIEGKLQGKYTKTHYVHANGEVEAKVWYSKKIKKAFREVKKVKTGNCETRYSLKINNFEINLSKGVSKFKNYDTIRTSKKIKLFSQFYLPIEIKKNVYKEYKNEENIYSLEETTKIAVEEAQKEIEKQIEDKKKILNKRVIKNHNNKQVEVEIIYEVLENIATKEKIVF